MNHPQTRMIALGYLGFSPDQLYIDLVDNTLQTYWRDILGCKFVSDDDDSIELVTQEEFYTRFDKHFQCPTKTSFNAIVKQEKLNASKNASYEMLKQLNMM